MIREKDIFSRNELLIGTEAMNKISKSSVILFGLGGVGSWCAESLIRSGIGHLTIVDSDYISTTNINRQLPTTTDTIGQAKTDVLKMRLLSINPHADITALQATYTEASNDLFGLATYDYIVDAIDSLEHKTSLILNATRTNAILFSSMGAALKLDASRIQTAEFWEIRGCPLAAALRRRFKKGDMPAKKFNCVYSNEALENKGFPPASSPNQSRCKHSNEALEDTNQSEWDERKARINGAMVHITAIFGFTLSGLLIQDIVKKNSWAAAVNAMTEPK